MALLIGGTSLVEDRTLIENAKSGHKDSFGSLVKRYYKNIYNLAYRMTNNREDAMDITQEVLLKAYRALHTFQPDKPFLPWIYRITWNTCADRGRRIGRAPSKESFEGSIEALKLPNKEIGPAAETERNELQDLMEKALSKLSDDYRGLITMFHIDGFSIREISEVTGLKETVVKNRLYRGRKMLRSILESEGVHGYRPMDGGATL